MKKHNPELPENIWKEELGESNVNAIELKIRVVGSKPPIWRKVVVPRDFTLGHLHDTIQRVMEWRDYHLHQFSYQGIDLDDTARLREIFIFADSIDYEYDFGDCWELKITFENYIEDYPYNFPVLAKFSQSSPPEDCGGIGGYYDKLAIIKNPGHEEYEETKQWLDEMYNENYNEKAISYLLTMIKLR